MLNQLVLVGRIAEEIQIKENEDGQKKSIITVAVPRSYKNENGEYDTDFIDCILWNMVAENTAEYCRKGDMIGVKGRLQNQENKLIVVAEKVTFLSTNKKEED